MNENQQYISFIDLLERESHLEIPIIQRDYAQGREDNIEIIQNFLLALFNSIKEGKILELDFIYGSKLNESFQPLDGQQRLTTLFLLHWYAAIRDKKLDRYRFLLKKFSYETRITSREFCLALVESQDVEEHLTPLSSSIIDSKWFFLAWKNDQTIEAMLRAIDLIQKQFNSIDNLSELLFDQKLIKFYSINLENIGLTDDLYIKMNARGKLLSPYENFKASFEKFIIDHNFENNTATLDSFAIKIDTIWTDFFWKHFRKNNKIDNSIMNLISTLVMARLVLEKRSNRLSTISLLHDNANNLKSEYFSEESFEYVKKVLDLYTEKYDQVSFKFPFPIFRHTPNKDFLDQITDPTSSASYSQKVLFYAQTEYLLNCKTFDEKSFQDWMRVIRNIVSRGSIDKGGKRPDIIRSPETFDGVINLISELAVGSDNIYNYLSRIDKLTSTFAREQIEEEKNKSKLILTSDDYKQIIFEMEDLVLFKGRIEFAFRCIEYNYEISSFNFEKFIKVKGIIEKYFNNENIDIANDIRRALLTLDDESGSFYDYWWSYWYVVGATKRCLIENFNEIEYYIYSTQQSVYIKQLIQRLLFEDILDIINNYKPSNTTPNWKVRLIKEKNLLDDHCKSNYIAIDEENRCFLLRSKRPRDIDGCFVVE